MSTETFYLMVDSIGLLSVVVMMHMTEKPTPAPNPMEQRIHAMLDDAVANEYDISEWTAEDIVADLRAFADLNDDETDEAITPHVITWKMKRGIVA